MAEMFIAKKSLLTKEILANLSYAEWKFQKSVINNTVNRIEEQMKSMASFIIKKEGLVVVGGLMPNEVKNNDRYNFLSKCFKSEFELLRVFNGNSPKKYKQKSSREKRENNIAHDMSD